ncbi:MAG: CBS domain-containing protein [Gammaproteobacteria bacterium]|nr:MAG: CBS domain-containing protein [Gammaproteobacteria bacterium]
MKIKNIMNTKLITLSMDSTLNEAKELFEANKIHHLLITDDEGLLAGVMTDRDLYKHLSPTAGTSQETHRDTALMQKKLHQIMSRNLITAKTHQSLNQAVVLFYDHHISCLPVVDEHNKPLGIITWRDILKVLALQYKKKLAAS